MVAGEKTEEQFPGAEEDRLSPGVLGIRENSAPLFLERIELHRRTLELVQPFETSFGRFDRLTRVFPALTFRTRSGESVTGVGECPPLPAPWYDGECDGTVAVALEYIVSSLRSNPTPVTDSASFLNRYRWVVGHNMAKAGVEGAYWDAIARLQGVPVRKLWGGTRRSVEAGTSVGLEETPEAMLTKVDVAVGEMKAARVKIKVKPGKDVAFVEAIRTKYPDLRLQVDANASYDLFDPRHRAALKELDRYNLMMIEQPGRNDDILDHARLLADLDTPVCLDESILHARHARQAVECWQKYSLLGKLVINIKPPRVGGFLEAMKIARLCSNHGVPAWCGGMLESALGKACNVHFSSREEVNLPGDHVGQGPYFREDVAPSLPCRDGRIELPGGVGWGIGEVHF
jgi:O-succinylbenzoate synthase